MKGLSSSQNVTPTKADFGDFMGQGSAPGSGTKKVPGGFMDRGDAAAIKKNMVCL